MKKIVYTIINLTNDHEILITKESATLHLTLESLIADGMTVEEDIGVFLSVEEG